LLKNPNGIFDITKNGGIVFIQDSEQLSRSLPAIYEIEIGWKKESRRVKVEIIESETFLCNLTFDSKEEFCSKHQFKEDCENSCGFGSKIGFCTWREYKPTNLQMNISSVFTTCTPDIESCSNQVCDALEISKKDFLICPQDCTKIVHGTPFPLINGMGIKSAHAGSVCTCDEHNQCACGPAQYPIILETTTQSFDDFNNSKSSGLYKESMKTSQHKECGTLCMMVSISSPTILIIIVIIVIVTFRHRSIRKMKKLNDGSLSVHYRGSNDTEIIHINILDENNKENFEKTYQKFDFDAKWEFDRNKLILDSTLGEGEFGKVVKGYATDLSGSGKETITTVAVKTIKTKNNSVELLSLLSEFQLLQEVSHPNVVKLLGACIRGEQPLIIIEYCCFSSLRNYLRLSRKLEESGDLKVDGVEPVTAKDVLSFLWQICKGMAYLADMKLVHRDLAARNVLLAEGKICKISDLGLSRDVYEDDAYLKKSKDRVPVSLKLK
jgi:proto-oncogene tyrosine-protein kinase Ret